MTVFDVHEKWSVLRGSLAMYIMLSMQNYTLVSERGPYLL